jgi:single-stranded-DNA-specific exonuclease
LKKNIVRRQEPSQAEHQLGGLHPVLSRLYRLRAIQHEAELNRELQALMPYHTLMGLPQAVAILREAIQQDQSLLIVGDFDADGATSTALAVRALRQFGAKRVGYLVPNRMTDGYGLTPELVVRAKAYSPDIIITVDNGIAHREGVIAAQAAGMRVVVTDHHLPGDTLPPADAIVNPNQPGDTFPSKNLAGVGVIFYVMLALCRDLTAQGWFDQLNQPAPNMARLLDIVALGTVADLVPLDHNNRILVHQGLRRIRAGQCISGIVALLELAGRDHTRAVANDLGFAVAARLNAAGRLEDMSLGIECLLCDDPTRARELAGQLDTINRERQVIEKEMQAQALKALQTIQLDQDRMPKGLALFDPAWHQGVIGILAARMKDRFHRPTIVFAPSVSDELKGSARSVPSLHIRDLLARLNATYPDLILKFGGHAMAAGLTIRPQQFDRFAKLFNEAVAAELDDTALQPILLSDGALSVADLSLDLALLLREAGPWGQTFPEPLFDDQFELLEQRIVGDKHLKLKLGKDGKLLDAIAFFVDTAIWPNHRVTQIHAAFRLDVNAYQGRESVQLIIEQLEPA